MKRPYTQLKFNGEPNDSISNSQTLPQEEKKGSNTTKNILISTVVGGLAAIVTFLVSGRKLPAAGIGAIVSVVAFDTLRKNQ